MAGVSVAAVMLAVVVALVLERAELPARAPLSARSLLVTVLAVPTPADAKLPVPLQVTTSVPTTPVSVQLMAAFDVPSYALLVPVIAGVSVAALMLAVVDALVEESA